MEKKTRPILIAVSAVSIVAVMFSIKLYFANSYEAERRISLEKQLDEARVTQKVLEKKYDELKSDRAELKLKLERVQDRLKTADERRRQELDRAKERAAELKSRLSEKDVEIKKLKGEIERERSRADEIKEKLGAQLKDVKSEYDDAAYQLDQVKMAKEILEERIKEIISRKEVELGRIIVKPAGEEVRNLEGQVLIVNKDFNFAIVNLGRKDGMKVGDMLELSRGDRYIGKVKVEKLYDTMVGATILPELIEEDIMVGDKARLL